MPISLSNSELAAIMEAARPISPRDRDAFLRDVAAECIVGRVTSRLQREHATLPQRGHEGR